ncbi:MAG: bifunctional UDP-N-acetylglucosamine diphosphorylase/glucosamine-1-phosphate N-acetyltransferase GlmU [Deltaproteobacteria bacterium]|nr:bifunctional UDP-N-acetylglucosamine diphosphorylase/glucosamine-1-phosphate N-acetyltransferase GlmU [Deltaproteobacteria bacterium]
MLAAGKGTRMKSERAKVLQEVCGLPLVAYPLGLAATLRSKSTVVVVGHQREAVEQTVNRFKGKQSVEFAHQREQLGTGHAVMTGMKPLKSHEGPVFILSGDVPLLRKRTLNQLKKAYEKKGGPLAFVTFTTPEPGGYGRVIRSENNSPVAIREFRDCSESEKKICEVNAGIYLIDAGFLRRATRNLKSDNAQGEFYLTDLIEMAAATHDVATVDAPMAEVSGANDRFDLVMVEHTLRQEIRSKWLAAGVSIQSPETVHIDTDCKIGSDTWIGAAAHLQGSTTVGKGCIIEPGAIIRDSQIADNVVIKAYSVLENAKVDSDATVGPMGRLRPGSHLKKGAHVGNWVELKNTVLGEGSKANHLTYLGDGEIGKGVNIGAGCIFCNYDGFLKHKTIIEDNVFVGSDSQMVAPVIIRKGAYVATGTTVTGEVPANAMAISRGRQINRNGLALKIRKRLKEAKKELQKKRGTESGTKK